MTSRHWKSAIFRFKPEFCVTVRHDYTIKARSKHGKRNEETEKLKNMAME
jgi:hypothetical protein